MAETIIIESDSMSHGNKSSNDTLDPGDKVEVVSVNSREDIVTYVEGKKKDHKMFGDYGDVIIYYKNGNEKDNIVIHRAVVWLEYDPSGSNRVYGLEDLGSFNVPSMGLYNVTTITIPEYGYNKVDLYIDLTKILQSFKNNNVEPHSGYLTKGDNNELCDQSALVDAFGHLVRPVKLEWIKGKADRVYESTGLMVILVVTIVIVEVILIVFFFRMKMKKKKELEENANKEREKVKTKAPAQAKYTHIMCPECSKPIKVPSTKRPLEFRCSGCKIKMILKE